MVSTPRTAPIRQGVHLPQDSMAQNSMAKRAIPSISALSSNTVSTYRARILDKTGVRNDVELALYAQRRQQPAPPAPL